MSERFDNLTERAKRVLVLAQEEAQRFNHNYIGTEHLLLGLVREGEGIAAKVLSNLGADASRVRAAVAAVIARGDRMVSDMSLTPRAKQVLALAAEEARRLNHNYVGTEHLLLGLVREGDSVASGLLQSLDIGLERVRAEIIAVVSLSGGPPHTPASVVVPLEDDMVRALDALVESGAYRSRQEAAQRLLAAALRQTHPRAHEGEGAGSPPSSTDPPPAAHPA